MKKVLPALILISLLAILIVPLVVSAQPEPIPAPVDKCRMRYDLTGPAWTARGFFCAPKGADCVFADPTRTCGVCCLMDTVYTVTNWVFVGVVVLVIIFILFGAFYMLTAAGNPERINRGRDFIIAACLGMLVALIAKAIPFIVRGVFGIL